MFPLRWDTLLPGLLAEKSSNEAARRAAALAGQCANRLLREAQRKPPTLRIEACQDWQKLSDLFLRHRPHDRITRDRSAEFLQWRYGQNTDAHPSGVYVVSDQRGHEGWFAIGHSVRGRHRQLRGFVLLDAFWPREHMSFGEIFQSLVWLTQNEGNADAVWFRPRFDVDLKECSRWMFSIRREAPSTYVITQKGDSPLDVNLLDLTPADGDSALPLSPMLLGNEVMNDCTVVP